MRDSVRQFSFAMEFKLQSKDEEKGDDGWLSSDCTTKYLVDRLKDEVAELQEAYENCDPKSLQKECVDVANFCMMICDKIRERNKHERDDNPYVVQKPDEEEI